MLWFLGGLCAVLTIFVAVLLLKIASLRKAADELRAGFAQRLLEDTNVGLDISSSDKRMRALAADIDKQLKILRKKHIRYVQGDRELKDAITNIAHDLRTPLTAICGYMELLEQQEMSKDVRRYLQVIGNRVDALKQLTEELLRYSIITSVQTYGDKETIYLNHALEELIAAHYATLIERQISPQISMPESPVKRDLNRTALNRILENILTNAIKYSDGDLRIALHQDGTIAFSNHASGLDEVSVGRLFDRFFTVETGQGGTGLGLSIARLLAEQMHASIGAHIKDGLFTIELKLP